MMVVQGPVRTTLTAAVYPEYKEFLVELARELGARSPSRAVEILIAREYERAKGRTLAENEGDEK